MTEMGRDHGLEMLQAISEERKREGARRRADIISLKVDGSERAEVTALITKRHKTVASLQFMTFSPRHIVLLAEPGQVEKLRGALPSEVQKLETRYIPSSSALDALSVPSGNK